MFEKYTVRKAVILKYEVQYYDNCTRLKDLVNSLNEKF